MSFGHGDTARTQNDNEKADIDEQQELRNETKGTIGLLLDESSS